MFRFEQQKKSVWKRYRHQHSSLTVDLISNAPFLGLRARLRFSVISPVRLCQLCKVRLLPLVAPDQIFDCLFVCLSYFSVYLCWWAVSNICVAPLTSWSHTRERAGKSPTWSWGRPPSWSPTPSPSWSPSLSLSLLSCDQFHPIHSLLLVSSDLKDWTQVRVCRVEQQQKWGLHFARSAVRPGRPRRRTDVKQNISLGLA